MTLIDKYELYEHAVQEASVEVSFIKSLYRRMRGKHAMRLREDFCGTFRVCCEWVKLGKGRTAVGVDLSAQPIEYGKRVHLKTLTTLQQKAIRIIRNNVLKVHKPLVDVICAFNFSFFIFKTRKDLLTYYKAAYKALDKDGIFVIDAFGGTEAMDVGTETRRVRGKGYRFTYIWEQTSYNPIRNEATFEMHFKQPNGRRMRKAFTYDWRMWTLPEIRETMMDAGFKTTYVYWEGVDKQGRGNGIFRRQEFDDACDVWIAYIVGVK